MQFIIVIIYNIKDHNIILTSMQLYIVIIILLLLIIILYIQCMQTNWHIIHHFITYYRPTAIFSIIMINNNA